MDLLRLRRDLVNRAHEQVGDYGDAQETVQTLMIRIYLLVQWFEKSRIRQIPEFILMRQFDQTNLQEE